MKTTTPLLEELSKLRQRLTGSETIPRDPDPLFAFFFALEGLSEMVVVTDLDHKIVYVNAACGDLLGYDPEELMGLKAGKYFEGIPGNPIDLAGKIAVEASDGFWEGEIFNQRKDGDLITINLKLTPLADSTGEVLGYVGISENITKRKQAEEALRVSEEMFRLVLSNIPQAVFWKDRDSRYLGCNKAMADSVGIDAPGDIAGKTGYDLSMTTEQADLFLECDRRIMESGRPELHIEENMRRPDGTEAWLETNMVPLYDIEGKVMGILGTFEDITERKLLDKELINARKLESLGILAGGIAHDFNNILAVILGNVSYARIYAEAESELYTPLKEAEAACLRAQGLTHQLLTFSRGGKPVKESIRIGELLKEATEFSLHGSNVSCRFKIARDLWPIEADRGQIGQVINNLVINADQAMPEGGELEVRAENVEITKGVVPSLEAGKYVKVEVEDGGVGISGEHLEKIFDPYFTTKQKGSGLGLASIYSIVINHSGMIRAISEPGKGATFVIYLPASKEEPKDEKVIEDIVFGEGRVLLMDDEAIIRDLALRLFTILGYEVETAADGKEAVEKYREARIAGRPFGVVILDLTVKGGMGGEEALKRLKAIDPEVKAIVSSGYSIDSVMSDYKAAGFSGMIAKPYSLPKISRVLRTQIGS